MIATLAWKEYKEQRAIWLAIALLAVVLSLMIAMMARGGMEEAGRDDFVVHTINRLLMVLVVAQGIVSGAQLLGGEKDAGNAMFLDILSSRRDPVWRTKLMVGVVLILMQAVVLYSIVQFLQLGDWSALPLLAILGWLALLWGMVGGAIFERVFPAILLSIALVVGNIIVFYMLPVFPEPILVALTFIPLAISHRIFCAADIDRFRKNGATLIEPHRRPSCWMTLFWLTEKQGRWIIWPGLVVSFVAGFYLSQNFNYVWPIISLVIGLICGLAVFSPEQSSEQERFLGAQRFPVGPFWSAKTLFWALAAAGMTALCYWGFYYQGAIKRAELIDDLLRKGWRGVFFPDQNAGLFAVEWAIYGFCSGLFASLLSRRIVIAGGLAILISLFLLAWWIPSLVFGGIRAEQILMIPIFLLITTRLVMWPWFSGRLYTRRHIMVLLGCGLAVFLWTGINLWYRAVEIPNVGKPFDVQAFENRINEAALSPANAILRDAPTGLINQTKTINEKTIALQQIPQDVKDDQKSPLLLPLPFPIWPLLS